MQFLNKNNDFPFSKKSFSESNFLVFKIPPRKHKKEKRKKERRFLVAILHKL